MAYTVETILAEKCESILKRNVVGTRPRDYYDVYMLTRMRKVRPRIFRTALRSTFGRCGTGELLNRASDIIDGILHSGVQEEYWRRYQLEYQYARHISFKDAVASVRQLLESHV